jgi:hypothetical protein
MSQSTWSEVPASSHDAAPGRWHRFLFRVVLPVGFAALLWAIDLRIAAVIVAVAATILTVIGVMWPALSMRIEHGMARFGVIVGRAIGLALLTLVNLLVFAPVALVMWLFRYDPLAPGVRRDEASYWHAHRGRSLPTRQFADERALWAPLDEARPRRRPVLRLATAVGVVSLLLLADLGAGWIYDEVSSTTHGTAAVADDTFDPVQQPAFRNAPWAAAMLAEQDHLPGVRDSYLGYRLDSVTGQYTNVVGGERVSYEPSGGSRPLSIWFFGGSALFGDGQRDQHTIPSEFARLAEADGISVRVHNYGRPAVSMWQEVELFEQLVAAGKKPDLVVFYDGFNDLFGELNIKLSAEPTNFFDSTAGETIGTPATGTKRTTPVQEPSTDGGGFSSVVDAYWDQSASRRVYDALDELFGGSDPPTIKFAKGVEQRDTSAAPAPDESLLAARHAISIQKRATKIASTVAAGTGAQAAFFWQPCVFTKRLLPDEQAYLGLAGYEPARWDPAVKEARRLLTTTPIVDLGGALDGATDPVLWDFVHTNEVGARLAAHAIYAHLAPKLERARRGS